MAQVCMDAQCKLNGDEYEGQGGWTQIVKGSKKFHCEEFELDPEAVKKL